LDELSRAMGGDVYTDVPPPSALGPTPVRIRAWRAPYKLDRVGGALALGRLKGTERGEMSGPLRARKSPLVKRGSFVTGFFGRQGSFLAFTQTPPQMVTLARRYRGAGRLGSCEPTFRVCLWAHGIQIRRASCVLHSAALAYATCSCSRRVSYNHFPRTSFMQSLSHPNICRLLPPFGGEPWERVKASARPQPRSTPSEGRRCRAKLRKRSRIEGGRAGIWLAPGGKIKCVGSRGDPFRRAVARIVQLLHETPPRTTRCNRRRDLRGAGSTSRKKLRRASVERLAFVGRREHDVRFSVFFFFSREGARRKRSRSSKDVLDHRGKKPGSPRAKRPATAGSRSLVRLSGDGRRRRASSVRTRRPKSLARPRGYCSEPIVGAHESGDGRKTKNVPRRFGRLPKRSHAGMRALGTARLRGLGESLVKSGHQFEGRAESG